MLHNLTPTGRHTQPRSVSAVDMPYSARLISRRYSVHPRMALVVAELVGFSIASISEARR